MSMTREQAWDLLTQYNQEEFHLRHAVTVEHVMRWFARELGYGTGRSSGGSWVCSTTWILSAGRRSTAKSPRS